MPHKDLNARKQYTREYNARRRQEERQKRHGERKDAIATRLSPPASDCIWAAGHFEGEGTLTLINGGRLANCRPIAMLTSTDREVIEFFQSRWPGQVRTFTPKSRNGVAREAQTWRLGANDSVECFIRDLLPHLRTERVRAKAALVLADIDDRTLYQRDPDVRSRSRERRDHIRRLNARGNIVMPGTSVTVGEFVKEDLRLAYEVGHTVPLLPPPHKPS